MKPPPPMLPALGRVTASAKAVATAASTAFPPLDSTAAPASQAGLEVHTTMPFFEGTPSSGAEISKREHGTARSTTTARSTHDLEAIMAAAYHRGATHRECLRRGL